MSRGFRLLKNRYLFGEVNDNPMRDDIPYPMIYDGGGSGGGKIFFAIDSAAVAGSSSPYNGKTVMTVTITVAPCDQSSLIGEQVDVVDWSSCLANAEAVGDLVGREGWAFRGIAESLQSGVDPGTLTPCHWVLDGLCCPP